MRTSCGGGETSVASFASSPEAPAESGTDASEEVNSGVCSSTDTAASGPANGVSIATREWDNKIMSCFHDMI